MLLKQNSIFPRSRFEKPGPGFFYQSFVCTRISQICLAVSLTNVHISWNFCCSQIPKLKPFSLKSYMMLGVFNDKVKIMFLFSVSYRVWCNKSIYKGTTCKLWSYFFHLKYFVTGGHSWRKTGKTALLRIKISVLRYLSPSLCFLRLPY